MKVGIQNNYKRQIYNILNVHMTVQMFYIKNHIILSTYVFTTNCKIQFRVIQKACEYDSY